MSLLVESVLTHVSLPLILHEISSSDLPLYKVHLSQEIYFPAFPEMKGNVFSGSTSTNVPGVLSTI